MITQVIAVMRLLLRRRLQNISLLLRRLMLGVRVPLLLLLRLRLLLLLVILISRHGDRN